MSDQLKQKKLQEAKQHIADAEKSLKTSLFKRKPDYDSAASAYSLAGTCYKVAKDLNNAIECYRKSAENHVLNNGLYHAAKQYEQVSFLANEAKNYQLTYESIDKAADLMMTDGTRDSAGIILEKAAGMLKVNDPARALKLYKKLLHISDIEDKNHELVVFHEQAIGLALKLHDYTETIELINSNLLVLDKVGTVEQITKYILTIILIHLSRDDWVGAKRAFENAQKKYEGRFGRVEELINSYDEKDDEKLKSLIKNYLVYAVDNEALKLANKIIKSEEWIKQCSEVNQNSDVRNPNGLVGVTAGGAESEAATPGTVYSHSVNGNEEAYEDEDDDIDLK